MAVNVNLEYQRADGSWHTTSTAGFESGKLLIYYVSALLACHTSREWRIRVRH